MHDGIRLRVTYRWTFRILHLSQPIQKTSVRMRPIRSTHSIQGRLRRHVLIKFCLPLPFFKNRISIVSTPFTAPVTLRKGDMTLLRDDRIAYPQNPTIHWMAAALGVS